MSIGRALLRPRARIARLARAGSVPSPGNSRSGPSATTSEAFEVAAGVGGVLLGALAGDLLADRVIRDVPLELESAGAGDVERRLVRIENEMRTRTAEERRATYVVVGSIVGGITAPFLARWLFEGRRP